MRRMVHVLALTTSVAALGVAGAGPVAAAAPVVERFPVDDTFIEGDLSAACGVEVTGTAKGHVIVRTFPDQDRTGPLELATINIALTFSADGRSVRLRDVGADLLRRTPDGTLVLSIVGQIPFGFTGVLKIDPETEEVLHEPQNSTEDDVQRLCAALTA